MYRQILFPTIAIHRNNASACPWGFSSINSGLERRKRETGVLLALEELGPTCGINWVQKFLIFSSCTIEGSNDRSGSNQSNQSLLLNHPHSFVFFFFELVRRFPITMGSNDKYLSHWCFMNNDSNFFSWMFGEQIIGFVYCSCTKNMILVFCQFIQQRHKSPEIDAKTPSLVDRYPSSSWNWGPIIFFIWVREVALRLVDQNNRAHL